MGTGVAKNQLEHLVYDFQDLVHMQIRGIRFSGFGISSEKAVT